MVTYHGLLDWAQDTGSGPQGAPGEGVPWHFILLVVAGLALLFALEAGLVFGIAKLVTGHAY